MKTPKEWLAHIKQASDTEVRHGSSVFLTESDILAIQREAFNAGERYWKNTVRLWSGDSKKLTRQPDDLV